LAFLGNKILKMEKDLDTKWHDAYMEVAKAHFDFMMTNWKAVHAWTGSQTDGLASAIGAGLTAAPAQAAPV